MMTYISHADIKLWAPQFFLERIVKTQMLEVPTSIRNHFLAKKQYESSMKRTETE